MSKLLHDFEPFRYNDTFFVWDDFDHYVTADTWTTTATNSGTIAVSDGVGGVVKVYPSDAENSEGDNDETYMHGTTEIFKFATDKPLFVAAKVRPLANTIAGLNVMFGLMDAVNANDLGDNGTGPVSSYSGALISKLDGGTVWQCESSIATAQTTANSEHTVGNNAWDVLAILSLPVSATITELHFFSADVESDGSFHLSEIGKTTSGKEFVAQTITHTNAVEMELVLACKNGEADDSQWVDCDWFYAAQKR